MAVLLLANLADSSNADREQTNQLAHPSSRWRGFRAGGTGGLGADFEGQFCCSGGWLLGRYRLSR